MKIILKIFIIVQVSFFTSIAQSLGVFNLDDLEKVKIEYLENNKYSFEIDNLKLLAELAIKQSPFTITKFDPPTIAGITINDYYSDSPYWWPVEGSPNSPYIRKDGLRNPDRFMEHKNELSEFYKGLTALVFYRYFTNDTSYDNRINRILKTWFIAEETKMNPHLKYSQLIKNRTRVRGVGIIDGRRLGVLTEAILLFKESGKIKEDIFHGIKIWYNDYLNWLLESEYGIDEKNRGNNHGTWWALQIASISNFLQNMDVIKTIDSYSKHFLIDNQIDSNAKQPLEEERTRSLAYSVFNLNAHTLLSSILNKYDLDNLKYRNKNGVNLIEVIDKLISFVEAPENWEIKQIKKFDNSKPYFLGVAGLQLENKHYLKIYSKLSNYEKSDLHKETFDPMHIVLDAVVKNKLTIL